MSLLADPPVHASVHASVDPSAADAYEAARDAVRSFLGGPQAVVFVRDTTAAFGLLARIAPRGTGVVVLGDGRDDGQLPWRDAVHLTPPATPSGAVAAARAALEACPVGPRLLVVTAASISGESWPVRELAEVAHACGARIAVDVAPHVAHGDPAVPGLDYVAFSGHRDHAAPGCGVLAGRADWLRASAPRPRGVSGSRRGVSGGRATSTAEAVRRHEAGARDVSGALGLAAACHALVS